MIDVPEETIIVNNMDKLIDENRPLAFACPICRKAFKNLAGVEKHFRIMRNNERSTNRPNIHDDIRCFYDNAEYKLHLILLQTRKFQTLCEYCHFPFVSESKKNRHKAENPECRQGESNPPPRKPRENPIKPPPNSVVTLGRYCATQDKKILLNNTQAYLQLIKM